MTIERCDECGFDGSGWTDASAIEAIDALPDQWTDAVAGLGEDDLGRRPITDMWSIAEYVDHVREVLFGMRFILDSAVANPGVDLGQAPEPRFDPAPRAIDAEAALAGVEREATALAGRLGNLSGEDWTATATVGDEQVDVHWVARHAVHDAQHHLLDVRRLRAVIVAEHARRRPPRDGPPSEGP